MLALTSRSLTARATSNTLHAAPSSAARCSVKMLSKADGSGAPDIFAAAFKVSGPARNFVGPSPAMARKMTPSGVAVTLLLNASMTVLPHAASYQRAGYGLGTQYLQERLLK